MASHWILFVQMICLLKQISMDTQTPKCESVETFWYLAVDTLLYVHFRRSVIVRIAFTSDILVWKLATPLSLMKSWRKPI